jgi:hypothetical protein
MNNYSFLRPIARPKRKVNASILRDKNLLLVNNNSEKANRGRVGEFSPHLAPTLGWGFWGMLSLIGPGSSGIIPQRYDMIRPTG